MPLDQVTAGAAEDFVRQIIGEKRMSLIFTEWETAISRLRAGPREICNFGAKQPVVVL